MLMRLELNYHHVMSDECDELNMFDHFVYAG
jgi:hypothetical protein